MPSVPAPRAQPHRRLRRLEAVVPLFIGLLVLLAAVTDVGARGAIRVPPDPHPQRAIPGAAAAATVDGPGTLREIQVRAADPMTPMRSVLIFTPAVAHPSQLPVLYLLHGVPGAAGDLCSPSLMATLDAAFRAGASPFIVACPDGNTPGVGDTEWADAVDGRTSLETFVTVQLRNAVEGSHPRPRSLRAIGGFSMGGFGAASIGLRHPDLYAQVVVLAGYFDIDDPDGVFGSDPNVHAAHAPRALTANSSAQRWFLGEASDDGLALTAHAAETFAPMLSAAGASVDLQITPGDHEGAWAVRQMSSVAAFLSLGWPAR